MNNVSQQVGIAIGIALISTFVATATSSYLSGHSPGAATTVQATVHGFSVGFWWAVGLYAGGAVILGALIRPRTRLHLDLNQPDASREPVGVIG
jgi:hypothetical protein